MELADAEPVKAAIRLQGEHLHQHEEKFSVIHQAVRDLAEQQHGLQASVNTQISDMAEAIHRVLVHLDAGATAPALPDAAAPPTTAAPLPGSHAVPLPRLAPPDKTSFGSSPAPEATAPPIDSEEPMQSNLSGCPPTPANDNQTDSSVAVLGFKGVTHPDPCLTPAFCSLSSALSSGSNTSQLENTLIPGHD
ncbi:hypothetical protein NQZ68_009957 [Dissostichus eleginoides]|nr:hypothetical protein NQZ68_009957 [Dissostichus eleginoides]